MIDFTNVTELKLGNVLVERVTDSLGAVLWELSHPEPVPTNSYFYVEDASGSDNTLSIKKNGTKATTIEVFKSTDGTNWESMGTTSKTAITATVPANSKLYLKANTNQWAGTVLYENRISCSENHNVGGNIMSLLYGDNFENQTSFPSGSTMNFQRLFGTDSKLISAASLTLPATTLANYCYKDMFSGCTALTTTPVLSTTTLSQGCYENMFTNCTALTTAQALPATTLAQSCYHGMFSGCTALTEAPALPATTLASSCYGGMFSGCTALTAAPALPATTLASSCYMTMFRGCTALTAAPALPATTLTDWCYTSMFMNCTSLTTAPVLPATTLTDTCYDTIFSGCTNLNSVTTYATNISASGCLANWLQNVSATGDFYNLGGATYPSGTSGIPTGWTEHTSL